MQPTQPGSPEILFQKSRHWLNDCLLTANFFFDEKKLIKFDACYKQGEVIAKIFWSKNMILLPLLYHMKQLPKRLVRVEMR